MKVHVRVNLVHDVVEAEQEHGDDYVAEEVELERNDDDVEEVVVLV